MTLEIYSEAFANEQNIPEQYTCQGDDHSPPLRWSGAPPATQSFALIVDDPDAPDPAAPQMVWVHWVLYNLPADVLELDAAMDATRLPAGTLEGLNDWKRTGYGGPCPPIGRHRYFFKLYALDITLPDLNHPTKERLVEAMQNHILAEAVMMGTYIKH